MLLNKIAYKELIFMKPEEIDIQNAIDNVVGEFQIHGKITNAIYIHYIKEAYKKVSGSTMRNYAREVGGQALVDEIDRILAEEKNREMR